MKRISAYQASDGTLFDDKKACAAHQRSINAVAGLTTIGDRIPLDDDLPQDDRGNYIIYDGEHFAAFCMKHAYEIERALSGKPLSSGVEIIDEADSGQDAGVN